MSLHRDFVIIIKDDDVTPFSLRLNVKHFCDVSYTE